MGKKKNARTKALEQLFKEQERKADEASKVVASKVAQQRAKRAAGIAAVTLVLTTEADVIASIGYRVDERVFCRMRRVCKFWRDSLHGITPMPLYISADIIVCEQIRGVDRHGRRKFLQRVVREKNELKKFRTEVERYICTVNPSRVEVGLKMLKTNWTDDQLKAIRPRWKLMCSGEMMQRLNAVPRIMT